MVYVEFEDEVSGAIPATWFGSGKPTNRQAGRMLVRYEAPVDPEGKGRTAVGFLRPSGDVVGTHPGTGEKYYKSDQRWIYSLEEAVKLEKEEPERFIRVKG